MRTADFTLRPLKSEIDFDAAVNLQREVWGDEFTDLVPAALLRVVGYVGGLYSSMPTTSFWLLHVASAVFGLVAFAVFKAVVGRRMDAGPQEQAAALS